MWIIIGRFIVQILMSVLLKLVLTVFSKEMIGKLMFACLHRLVKLTSTTKDDEYIDKLEKMYWGISDTTDQQSDELINKIKKD
ncbi:TPA: hypothetical protein ACNZ5U_004635 [Enterobacter kobei]|uniref:hypothetical protein n=1 Tax=Enterobacter kobei TaxID=208224 RepID=UPI003B85AB10